MIQEFRGQAPNSSSNLQESGFMKFGTQIEEKLVIKGPLKSKCKFFSFKYEYVSPKVMNKLVCVSKQNLHLGDISIQSLASHLC